MVPEILLRLAFLYLVIGFMFFAVCLSLAFNAVKYAPDSILGDLHSGKAKQIAHGLLVLFVYVWLGWIYFLTARPDAKRLFGKKFTGSK